MATGFYQKIDGVWTQAERPYVKDGVGWKGANEAYLKTGGIWTKFWEYDNIPSASPTVSFEVVKKWQYFATALNANWIKVKVKLPGNGDPDPDLKMIRVLTTYAGAAPSSQYGGTDTELPDNSALQEPWSDFYYNGWGPDGYHPESNYYSRLRNSSETAVVKPWPRNAATTTQLPAGTYYFTAWSQDQDGNWSEPSYNSVTLTAAGQVGANTVYDQYFYPTHSGTINGNNTVYTPGVMTQSNTGTRGTLYHGQDVGFAVAESYSTGTVTMNSAQVLLYRTNDSGDAQAKIYAGTLQSGAPDETPGGEGALDYNPSSLSYLGTLAKGEAKWFALPPVIRNAMNFGLYQGLIFWYKDPNVVSPTTADYSVLESVTNQPKSGLLRVNWTVTY